jgi:hypothetical protein
LQSLDFASQGIRFSTDKELNVKVPTIFVEVRDPAKPRGLVDAVPIVNAVDDVDAEDEEGVRFAPVYAPVRALVCVSSHDCLYWCVCVTLYQQRSLYEVDADSSGDEAGALARTGSGTPTVNGERASLLQDGRAESKQERGKRVTGRSYLHLRRSCIVQRLQSF